MNVQSTYDNTSKTYALTFTDQFGTYTARITPVQMKALTQVLVANTLNQNHAALPNVQAWLNGIK